MRNELVEKKEKKVEYVELIYDLIFVYIIGRNNSLLHHVTGGFVDFGTFSAYLLCTLAVIQMWNLTTYYINIHGRHSVREHVMLFVNMFHGRPGFEPWVGKTPLRRAWQPPSVFLPGEPPWKEEHGRLQSMGFQRVRHD